MLQESPFKINGHSYKWPTSLKPTVVTMVDSGRATSGEVVGQKIGRDQYKLDSLKWAMLTSEEWSDILKEMNDFTVTITLWDVVSLTWKDIVMYPGNRTAEYPSGAMWYNDDGSPKVLLNCSVNFVDMGKQ